MALKYPFFDPALSLKDRLRDLIYRLTPEEKAGFIPSKNQPVARLGITPFNFGAEGAHGFVDREGNNTTFPQTIGLAATWDRGVLGKVGEIASIEARVYYNANDRKGGLAIWSPTVDLERDPRWGRTEEGYGEDPFLTGELSSAYIRAAQGDDPFYLRVSCGPKHFFANNNEKNRISCSCSIPPRVMNEYYLAPFKAAIQGAKAVSMMTAYNEVNGIPMMIHPIQKKIVKDEWGMEGNVVTDGGDFLQTVTMHHYFETHAETIAAAFKSGGDTMTDDGVRAVEAVMEALEKGLITEAELDEHIERILSMRFRFGEFDPPGKCPYDKIDSSYLMKDEYRKVSREAVRKSAVLLKNEGFLPLCPETTEGAIAVLGPLSNILHLDWYTGIPTYAVTPLEGLRNVYGKEKILHADFRDLVSFTTEDGRPLVLADGKPDSQGKTRGKLLSVGKQGQEPARFYLEDWGWGSFTLTDEASGLLLESVYWRKEPGGTIDNGICTVAASGKSTLTWFNFSVFNLVPQGNGLIFIRTFDNRNLAAAGQGPIQIHDDPAPAPGELFRMKIEREGLTAAVELASKAARVIFIAGNNPMINGRECTDRPSLNLPPSQEKFLNRVIEVNPKTALVIISGYPYTCKSTAEKVPAVLWMAPGIQETGNGLADIISGAYSPAGRLPLTWYEDESQLPPSILEYDIISAGTTYQYFNGKVLWPFGHGLSYSSFEYSDLRLKIGNDIVNVSFKLKNTGSIPADEVPQMYVSISACDTKRPIKTLKGFDRISFAPGEEKEINFELPVKELAVWDSWQGRFVVETCYCEVMIGASSADIKLTAAFAVQGEKLLPRKILSPIYAERFDDYAGCYLHEKRGSGIPAVFSREWGRLSWICFKGLDFCQEFSCISAIVQGEPGSRIEVRLDSPDGALAGTLDVPNTGEICNYELSLTSPRRRPTWAYAETTIDKKVRGVHDLYLVLFGKTGIWSFEIK